MAVDCYTREDMGNILAALAAGKEYGDNQYMVGYLDALAHVRLAFGLPLEVFCDDGMRMGTSGRVHQWSETSAGRRWNALSTSAGPGSRDPSAGGS